ncbi:unnamed protein product [Mycena citricolor]|uniref:tRNA pseudouridine synthase n=1 Tax=Mycena citricolor TaxID=2018698 RepID=A0AAD2H0A7_9AGAR|nr:unnamed protein product [Mycena citricolor]
MISTLPYDSWSKEELIAKLRLLESDATGRPASPRPLPPPSLKLRKPFDFAAHPRRKIALKFSYAGWAYNGLSIQSDATPLPTVEGVLFDALAKARLVDPAAGMEGCGWERCGRTDRGVSAAGQVVSLWVRSALGRDTLDSADSAARDGENPKSVNQFPPEDFSDGLLDAAPARKTIDAPEREHSYALMLNRILPHTIRILAWSPVADSFSSRYSCISRHYKYFFSPEHLDVTRMAEAAGMLVGLHDFRNFCKIDGSKQITLYKRRVLSASINQHDRMLVFDLIGTAFLYHQVRHIMAVLFLVGSGLEQPNVAKAMLNVDGEGDARVETKPEYQMADSLPLVLYECHYASNDVSWHTDREPEQTEGLWHRLHSIQGRSQMYATLNSAFHAAACAHHPAPRPVLPTHWHGFTPDNKTVMNIPLGGSEFRRTAKYIPLLKRPRGEHFDVVNERWRSSRVHKDSEQQ